MRFVPRPRRAGAVPERSRRARPPGTRERLAEGQERQCGGARRSSRRPPPPAGEERRPSRAGRGPPAPGRRPRGRRGRPAKGQPERQDREADHPAPRPTGGGGRRAGPRPASSANPGDWNRQTARPSPGGESSDRSGAETRGIASSRQRETDWKRSEGSDPQAPRLGERPRPSRRDRGPSTGTSSRVGDQECPADRLDRQPSGRSNSEAGTGRVASNRGGTTRERGPQPAAASEIRSTTIGHGRRRGG